MNALEPHAQAVLDARAAHPGQTLADLYDPLAMPTDLRRAHEKLDKAVDRLYRKEPFKDDRERLEFLLERYGAMVQKNQKLAPGPSAGGTARPMPAPSRAYSTNSHLYLINTPYRVIYMYC